MRHSSQHVEPHGALQIARHYVRELVYGANDGIITTFAVVAGVSGGGLSLRAHESVLDARQVAAPSAHEPRRQEIPHNVENFPRA